MALSVEQSLTRPQTLQQHGASWQDYLALRDRNEADWRKIAFNAQLRQGWLWAQMGKEGPNHAAFSDLMTMMFGFWAAFHPEIPFQSFGRCLIEKPQTQACAPDLVLYKGSELPQWQTGEPRHISTLRHRLPDLVGEISDTTLSLDLDEQKQLYAASGIGEYWVIDVRGRRVFAFALSQASAESGTYLPITHSQVLTGLPIALIEQTLEKLDSHTNTAAASWFMQQLQTEVTPAQTPDSASDSAQTAL